jgi:hypothetical protein
MNASCGHATPKSIDEIDRASLAWTCVGVHSQACCGRKVLP